MKLVDQSRKTCYRRQHSMLYKREIVKVSEMLTHATNTEAPEGRDPVEWWLNTSKPSTWKLVTINVGDKEFDIYWVTPED